MKKLLCILCALCLLSALTACGKTKTLHCDACGKEISVKESSNREEDWIVYCEKCNDELFGENPLFNEG